MPTEEQTKRIIDLWENTDLSYARIAEEINLTDGKQNVYNWVKGLLKEGKVKPRSDNLRKNTKNATEAKKNYDRKARLELSNEFYLKIHNKLQNTDDLKALKDIAIIIGILEDKRVKIEPGSSDNNGVAAIHKFNELLNGSQTAQPETNPEHKTE